jgi:acyl-CoA thioesterase II
VDPITFYGLEPAAVPGRWRMPIVRGLVSGTGALFGGCGLGACIEVAEQLTGRPLVWATAQYLTFARPPAVLELDALEVVRGHQISQVRVLAHVGEQEILTVLAALGDRPHPLVGQWANRPEVADPDDCPPRVLLDRHQGTISDRLETRIARGRSVDQLPGPPGDGNSALWVRMPGLAEMSAAGLAIVGDFVPFGISQALGVRAGGNSLDNTLRVASRVATDWVLADIRVHAIADGFGHGLVHLWAEDGTLLGTASQSTIVRSWRDAPFSQDASEPEASGAASDSTDATRAAHRPSERDHEDRTRE